MNFDAIRIYDAADASLESDGEIDELVEPEKCTEHFVGSSSSRLILPEWF